MINKLFYHTYLLYNVNTIYHKAYGYSFLIEEKGPEEKYLSAQRRSHRGISRWRAYSWSHELPEGSIVVRQSLKLIDLRALEAKHL